MLFKEIFSQLYYNSCSQNNPIWERQFDYKDQNLLLETEEFFQFELMGLFKHYNASERVISIVHKHFDEIISRKNNTDVIEYKEIFSYLQLTWGLFVATQLNWDGEFVYTHNVFMKSVFDNTFENGEQYDINDIEVFELLNSENQFVSNYSKPIIDQWFSQLYYYSRSFSGLNEWCEFYFLEVYYGLCKNLIMEVYHPQYLSNLLSWCEVNLNQKRSIKIRDIIQREFDQAEWSNDPQWNEIKCTLGVQLLLCKDYRDNNKHELFKEIEENSSLHPSTKMQAMISLCYDKASLKSNFIPLLESIYEFNQYISKEFPNRIDSIYQRARIFKNLLNGCISLAVDLEQGKMIDQILYAFYNIKNPEELGRNIYLVPNVKNYVAFCFSDKTILDKKESQNLLIEIVDIENRAFNKLRLLKGGITQKITPTNQPMGLPVPKLAKEYENKLFELYDFSKLRNELPHLSSLSQFDFNSFPLQSLMLKSIGETLPINSSLSKKRDFSKVENVLFWSGFSQTSEIETEALKEIFGSKEVVFEIHNEENSNLIRFISRIDELNPEIIWISSHGEYHHYEPNVSKIKLSEKESIGIRDFEILINKGDKRRLLFLNICEGGIHFQSGEFKNLGFPNLLASNNQDVISHLWMVEPRFAYVFGAFLALGITHLQKNYFEAFQYSLLLALSDKTSILDELEKIPLQLFDLKERIENNDGTEWGNLISTGSPIYNI